MIDLAFVPLPVPRPVRPFGSWYHLGTEVHEGDRRQQIWGNVCGPTVESSKRVLDIHVEACLQREENGHKARTGVLLLCSADGYVVLGSL